MITKHFSLVFLFLIASFICANCQTSESIESIYNKHFISIDDDFDRIDSLNLYIHPKNNRDMRQSIQLLELEKDRLGPVAKKPLQHVMVNITLFMGHRAVNEYEKGVAYIVESKEIANRYAEKTDKWDYSLATVHLEMAFVYYFEQKSDQAFSEARKALDIYKRVGNDRKLAEAYWRLGIAKSQMGKTNEALSYYNQAAEVIDSTTNLTSHLRVEYLRSIELTLQNRFSQARAILLDILPKMKEDNHVNYPNALVKMGQVETQLGNFFPAEKYLKEADELTKNTNDLNSRKMVAARYEEYYLATGQFKEAYDRLFTRKAIADSVNRKKIKEEHLAFQNQFSELNSQKEIKDLKYEQALQASKFRNWLGALAGLFALVLGGLGFLWYRKERKREQSVLIAAKEAEVQKVRDHLLTSVTHGLRTPLALVMGQLDELRNEPLSSHAEMIVASSKKSTEQLLHQVNQLMDLNQLESNAMTVNPSIGDMSLFLEDVFLRAKQSGISKEFSWTKNFEKESLLCKLDYEKLNTVLMNIFSNAIKYCDLRSHIEMKFYQKRNSIVVEVKDNGPGILDMDQKHIFDWYYRAKNKPTNLATGSGVGLALSKELVELMGGMLLLESEKGVGSKFVVQVPYQTVDPKEIPEDTSFVSNQGVQKPNTIHPEVSNNLPHLLLLENHDGLTQHITRILANEYSITSFPTASAGESWAMENIPDIILTNLMMPDMSGIELSNSLKSNFLTNHIPIVMLTANSSDRVKIQSLQAGVDVFMTKPFDGAELKLKLKNLLQNVRNVEAHLNKDENGESVEIEDPFLKKLNLIIEAHFADNDLNVESFAGKLYISRMQLFKKMKATLGITPSKFIRNYRLEKSAKLLQETEMSIAEIAHQCGFSSPEYFSTVYKEVYEKSPSIHRSIKS